METTITDFLLDLAARNGGILTSASISAACQAEGRNPESTRKQACQLGRDGRLVRVGRGEYRTPDCAAAPTAARAMQPFAFLWSGELATIERLVEMSRGVHDGTVYRIVEPAAKLADGAVLTLGEIEAFMQRLECLGYLECVEELSDLESATFTVDLSRLEGLFKLRVFKEPDQCAALSAKAAELDRRQASIEEERRLLQARLADLDVAAKKTAEDQGRCLQVRDSLRRSAREAELLVEGF